MHTAIVKVVLLAVFLASVGARYVDKTKIFYDIPPRNEILVVDEEFKPVEVELVLTDNGVMKAKLENNQQVFRNAVEEETRKPKTRCFGAATLMMMCY